MLERVTEIFLAVVVAGTVGCAPPVDCDCPGAQPVSPGTYRMTSEAGTYPHAGRERVLHVGEDRSITITWATTNGQLVVERWR